MPLAGLCAGLAALSSPGLTIDSAQEIAGAFAAPDGTRVEVRPACRVAATAHPVPGSRIRIELWLPRQGWNGRYYQLGSGGFAGAIHYPSLAAELARGNAVAATDTGHSGNGFDASWALGNPVAVADYGYRSVGATAAAARRLVGAYYGRPARYRYFVGCSNGGRQALVAAARYPRDWDGVLAGSPANPWTRQLELFATLQHSLRRVPGRLIPPARLPLVHAGGLTPVEREGLRLILRAGYQPAGAAGPDGWARWIVNDPASGSSQFDFAVQSQRYLFGNAPDWVPGGLRPPRPAPAALRRTLDVRPAGLARFAARGGRILSYFGWADPVISPRLALSFYRAVPRAAKARGFYRLFMAPGMGHCQGGTGPTSFGQSLPAPALRDDALHDVRRALEAWVEQGRPPRRLVAQDPATGRTRTLFPRRD